MHKILTATLILIFPFCSFSQLANEFLKIGIEKYRNNDFESAIQNFNKAIEKDQRLYSAYWNRGNTRMVTLDYMGALQDFNKAIEIDPTIEVAYADRGYTKTLLQDYSGAIRDYDKAIQISPKISIRYFQRAEAKDKIQDYKSAITDYDKSIILNPIKSLNGDSYFKRGIDKLRLNIKKDGCLDLSKAIELGNPNANEVKNKYCQ